MLFGALVYVCVRGPFDESGPPIAEPYVELMKSPLSRAHSLHAEGMRYGDSISHFLISRQKEA